MSTTDLGDEPSTSDPDDRTSAPPHAPARPEVEVLDDRPDDEQAIDLDDVLAEPPDDAPFLQRHRRLVACGCLFAFVFATAAVWALSTPPYGSPDEAAHVVRAVSIWEGDVGKKDLIIDGRTSSTEVRVPQFWADGERQLTCWIFQSDQTPACAPPFQGSSTMVTTRTTAGLHPHLFYALVGWVGVLKPTGGGFYLMRLVAALLCALMIAPVAATFVEERRGPLAVLGALTAITPVALFLCGSVNPNGFEICAAIAAWVHAMAFARRLKAGEPVGARLTARLAVSLALLCLTRPLSPLFAAVICLVALAVHAVGPMRILRSRHGLVVVGVTAAAVAEAGWWLLHSGMLSVELQAVNGEHETAIKSTVGAVAGYYQQMIGAFGWLDAGVASVPVYCWVFLGLGALMLALGVGSAPERRAAVVVLGLSWLLPVTAQYGEWKTNGLVWQGRYSLPLVAGLPILAMLAVERGGRLRIREQHRMSRILAAVMIVGQCAGYYWAMRRFTVSQDGSLWYLSHPTWRPYTASPTLLLVAFVLVTTLGIVAATWSMRPEPVNASS